MNPPYTFKSYRSYIAVKLESSDFGRGSRKDLSAFLGVHKSFISAVLSGNADFTQEHIFKLSKFLGIDSEDRNCLLLMLNRERAGSEDLKNYYSEELKKLQDERDKVKSQIRSASSLTETEYSLYTSKWYLPVIHMYLRNPAFRDVGALSKAIKISTEEVSRALKILEKIGFAEQIKGEWHSKVIRYNADKDSPGLRAFHLGCRQMVNRSLDSQNTKDLHYSLIVSVDSESVDKLRTLILELIKNFEPIIQKADDKEVVAFTLDLFKV